MTSKEAIEVLEANYPDAHFELLREAVDVAIEALKADVPGTNDGDMISRKAAIDAINALHEKPNAWLDSAVDAVITLPSAQPEQRWIPCSEETGEGYPKEYGYYYVTEQNYGFYLDAVYKQRVTHTSYFGSGGFTDRFYVKNSSNITAWMPLPDPYGGESDE